MKKTRYNPERRVWRGVSYKVGFRRTRTRIRTLREKGIARLREV